MEKIIAGIAIFFGFSFGSLAQQNSDIIVADFEGKDYGKWKTTGEAFGAGPAHGTLPRQMHVEGFTGKGLVNSFSNGDGSVGMLTSPEFKIERKMISFLIGGGGHEGKTCMNLLIDGKVVRTATGPNTRPGGSEILAPALWDVSEFAGKTAIIEIVDNAKGGWGHINVDQIVQTDRKPAALLSDQKREFEVTKHYLNLPVKNGAPKRIFTVFVDGKEERKFDIELADSIPDWWAVLDVSPWKGRKLVMQVNKLPEDSVALKSIEQDDVIKGSENLYQETLRPQFHFSPKRGWNNDPNGMAFFKNEYHLFFQHNPYGWGWGNMHWGHAVSKDMVHWREFDDVLAPDEFGPMFSGSAVVDWKNTSGFGKAGQPPLVLIYTAAGNPTVQCIAYSTDGRTFTKYSGNPVVKQITGGNRDPKVFWHPSSPKGYDGTSEPSGKWVMCLYVGLPSTEKDDKGKPKPNHTIHFLGSPDLKNWTVMSQTENFYECPDFFELPVDGDAKNKKWVLTAASSEYMVGTFDGTKFTPESEKLKGHRGQGFYAAQTFSDIPADDGRRIQIGWLQAPAPGMPFNQAMTIPLDLKLRNTAEGIRMTWTPVKELKKLRAKSHRIDPLTLKAGDANPLAAVKGELLEIHTSFEPGDAEEISLNVRGATVAFDVKKQELNVNGRKAPAPLSNGKQQLVIYVDRTALEVFASDGLTYMPKPFIPKAEDLGIELSVKGGNAKITSLEVHELKSAWNKE
ncbi:MAG: glycoside hydrolase family 32 protein [Kiritimatiellae bacterium]|nr:glycoside hydrolase family 32 protein [Kiritimatiellia bacterium]MDD5519777.1 glycoside hydrolase family 32 protein [Kiritimatiellia bacterium]